MNKIKPGYCYYQNVGPASRCTHKHADLKSAAICQAVEDIRVRRIYDGPGLPNIQSDRELCMLEKNVDLPPLKMYSNEYNRIRRKKFDSISEKIKNITDKKIVGNILNGFILDSLKS